MEPIISPWTFYLVGVCGKVNTIAQLTFLLSAIPFFFAFLELCFGRNDDKRNAQMKKLFIGGTTLLIFSFVGMVFVPTEQQAMTMLAASVVTPDNISAVQGNIVDFIAEIAKAIANAKQQ